MSSTRRAIPLLIATLALAACAEEAGPAIDFSLAVDGNLNAPRQVVELLGSLRVVVDSPDGLYPADAADDTGELKLEDIDGDGAVELWTTIDMASLGRLPWVRIEQGGLKPVPLDLRFEGTARDQVGEVVAAGGIRGLRFAGEAQRVDVPFNLKQRYRPPQVTQVIPADGAGAGNVASVFVVFPKRMDAESLRALGAIELRRTGTGSDTPVPAQEIRVQFLAGNNDSPTTVEYRLAAALEPAHYRLIVTSAVRDADGRALDQVPMQPGDQPFSSTFEVGEQFNQPEATATACPKGDPTCSQGADPTKSALCHEGGTACPDGMTCSGASCILDGCAAGCTATGYVCDAAQGYCVTDCRFHGSHGGCTAERPTCGGDGVCVP